MSIASFRERLLDFRSCWIVFIHIVQGRPGGLLQFSKGKLLRSSWHLFGLAFAQCGQTGKDVVLGQCLLKCVSWQFVYCECTVGVNSVSVWCVSAKVTPPDINAILPPQAGDRQPENVSRWLLDALLAYMVSEVSAFVYITILYMVGVSKQNSNVMWCKIFDNAPELKKIKSEVRGSR